jgi:6-phosphofructokinase 1
VVRAELDALIVIGGNGSLTGAQVASRFRTTRDEPLRVVGVPASIDNDVGYTSHAIGVDTALNTIVEACDRISDTAASHNRAFFVEVMGRDCGYLAMAAAVATGADAVLFRESGRSEEELVEHVVRVIESAFGRTPPKPRVLILKAEGVKASLESIKKKSDERLAAKGMPVETRVTVLGHVVRGGAPSAQDRLMSGRLGRAAAWAAMDGHTNVMIGWQASSRVSGPATLSPHDPHCTIVPIDAVLTETRALLDGTSPVAQWRVRALSEAEDLLHF